VQAEPEKLEVTIPNLLPKYVVSKRYTCSGENESPAVQWGSVPPGTAEIVMFVANVAPVRKKLFFDWAVAGLKPTSHGISAGSLPAGAVVGRNTSGEVGYSVCLPKGSREENFVVRVMAVARPLAARPGFNAEALYKETEGSAKAVGLGGWLYKGP
jgi:phosphatidylethanolamine-binding protein (PEBP) family uncharacterized protein